MLDPAQVTCPKCWETIELLVDPSAGDADYTEDCPVCCQPMRVRVRFQGHENFSIEVEPES